MSLALRVCFQFKRLAIFVIMKYINFSFEFFCQELFFFNYFTNVIQSLEANFTPPKPIFSLHSSYLQYFFLQTHTQTHPGREQEIKRDKETNKHNLLDFLCFLELI